MKNKFPNLTVFLTELTAPFNGGLEQNTEAKIAFQMPVITFENHVGDNLIILRKVDDGYQLSVESFIETKLKLKTISSTTYLNDLTIEEWDKEVNDTIINHLSKPEYSEFSKGKLGKNIENSMMKQKSGCMLIFIIIVFISITSYNYFN